MSPVNDASLFTASLTPGQLDARSDPRAAETLGERVARIRADEAARIRARGRVLAAAFGRIVAARTARAQRELAGPPAVH